MNICFLVSNIDPIVGGTERVTQTIANNLNAIGYQSFFMFSRADNQYVPQERKFKFDDNIPSEGLFCIFKNYLEQNDVKVLIVVNRIFQAKKYQYIYKRIKKETKIKIIASLHAAPDNWVNKNRWGLVLPKVYIKEFIKTTLKLIKNPHIEKVVGTYNIVDRYLLLSKSYIKDFIKIYRIKDNGRKLIAIPNPCPFKDEYQGEERENIVLIVSRMQEDQKRIYAAIKIWRRMCHVCDNWNLVIVGDGPDMPIYKEKSKGVKNIHFKGHSCNVQDYYKKSKIFVMTSIWEGLPMTLIEAMHYGCVPVAFDSFCALHDLITSNKTGFIIPNNNIDAFCDKLLYLIKNEKILSQMTDNILKQPNSFKISEIISIWDRELKNLVYET